MSRFVVLPLHTFFVWFFLRLFLRLSRWLSHNAPERWKTALEGQLPLNPTPPGGVSSVEWKVNNQIELITGSDGAYPHDTPVPLSTFSPRPAWTDEIQPFLANQLSEHTRRAYEIDLKQFFLFLSPHIDLTRLSGLRAEHVILYRKFLEEGRLTGKPLQKTTINRKLAVVKSFFNWLKANRVLSDNPAQFVKGYPQSQESALKGLSDEETRRILDKPNQNSRAGALHGAILHCLFFLGLRKGELIGLKMGDLDSERGVPVMRVRGKGHKVRVLPLVASVRLSLEHYFSVCQRDRSDKDAPLFEPTKNPRTLIFRKPLNPNAITYIVLRYAKRAGVLKKISPHSCRATCISNALDRRATHRSVQHLAGWSTPLMIQRYDKRREELKNSAAFLVDYAEATAGAAPSS